MGAAAATDARDCRAAAFFDVDGTLVSTHIVHQYLFVRRMLARQRGPVAAALYPLWAAGFIMKCLRYLYLDRVSRTRMNIAFYRNYAGLPSAAVQDAAEACFHDVLAPHLHEPAVQRLIEHARAGHRVALLTGSVDIFIAPLARHLSERSGTCVHLLARSLVASNGRFTGALDGPPIGEGEKVAVLQAFARDHAVDLPASFAYGDNKADLPMLEAVGHPQVVNPDRTLGAEARRRGWAIHRWAAGDRCG
jgi:HAD superfamily hydrolase (TIGR01490 family)